MGKAKINFLFFISAVFTLSIPAFFLYSNNNSNFAKDSNFKFSTYFLADQNENNQTSKEILKQFAEQINISAIKKYKSIKDVNFEDINEYNIDNYFKNLPSSNDDITVVLKRVYISINEFEEINLEYEFSYSYKDPISVTYSFKKIAFVNSSEIIINYVVIPISLLCLTIVLSLVIYFAIKKTEKKNKYRNLKNKMKK